LPSAYTDNHINQLSDSPLKKNSWNKALGRYVPIFLHNKQRGECGRCRCVHILLHIWNLSV